MDRVGQPEPQRSARSGGPRRINHLVVLDDLTEPADLSGWWPPTSRLGRNLGEDLAQSASCGPATPIQTNGVSCVYAKWGVSKTQPDLLLMRKRSLVRCSGPPTPDRSSPTRLNALERVRRRQPWRRPCRHTPLAYGPACESAGSRAGRGGPGAWRRSEVSQRVGHGPMGAARDPFTTPLQPSPANDSQRWPTTYCLVKQGFQQCPTVVDQAWA